MDGLGLFYSLFGIGVIVAGILASWLFYEYSKSGSKDPLALHPAPKYNHLHRHRRYLHQQYTSFNGLSAT
jgi:hypothetical protein